MDAAVPHDSFSQADRSSTDRTLRRTAGRPERLRRPAATKDDLMPAQDGARSDYEPHRGEAVDRQGPGQQRQPCPVRPRQPRMSPRLLAEGDPELMAQHGLGVFHHDSRRDSLSNDTVRETIRKISFKPQAENPRTPGQVSTGPPGTKHATEPTARRGCLPRSHWLSARTGRWPLPSVSAGPPRGRFPAWVRGVRNGHARGQPGPQIIDHRREDPPGKMAGTPGG